MDVHGAGCEQTVDGPPLNTHCSALHGPATVRTKDHN
jgi:hypothetical protein